jgi:hypothetical protein
MVLTDDICTVQPAVFMRVKSFREQNLNSGPRQAQRNQMSRHFRVPERFEVSSLKPFFNLILQKT